MSHKIEVLESLDIVKVTYGHDVTMDKRLYVVHEHCTDHMIFNNVMLLNDTSVASVAMTCVEQTLFGQYLAYRGAFNGTLVAVLLTEKQSVDEIIVKECSKMGYQI